MERRRDRDKLTKASIAEEGLSYVCVMQTYCNTILLKMLCNVAVFILGTKTWRSQLRIKCKGKWSVNLCCYRNLNWTNIVISSVYNVYIYFNGCLNICELIFEIDALYLHILLSDTFIFKKPIVTEATRQWDITSRMKENLKVQWT